MKNARPANKLQRHQLELVGLVTNVLYCNIIKCEFALQSRFYVHFRTNIQRKGTNSLILPAVA